MRPTDLDNNPLLLCHCTYDPNLLFPLFFQKELKSVETVGKALHQLRRIIFLPYILSYIQSETNFIAVKQPKESKDSKLAELTKDYKRVWQGFKVTERWIPWALKTFDLWQSRNPKQLQTLQIANQHHFEQHKNSKMHSAVNFLKYKNKHCTIRSTWLAQADNRPPSYATAGWTSRRVLLHLISRRALVHSILVLFMFETFRERG
jgi:hypothetical protein